MQWRERLRYYIRDTDLLAFAYNKDGTAKTSSGDEVVGVLSKRRNPKMNRKDLPF